MVFRVFLWIEVTVVKVVLHISTPHSRAGDKRVKFEDGSPTS